MEMIKNYFIKLWEILFEAGKFGIQNIKSMPLIWFLILVQFLLGIPLLYIKGIVQISAMKPLAIVIFALLLVVYLLMLFLLFKKVFNIASSALDKEKISNIRIFKSLLSLGLFNCIPALFVLLCMLAVNFFENLANPLQIASLIFTYIFYLSMSLSITAIVYWQDKSVFSAILKSLNIFFSSIKYSMVIFIFMYGLAALISWVICALFYYVLQHFNFLDNVLISTVSAVVNVYCLYVFATFYIGAQAKIIKDYKEVETIKKENELEEKNDEQL